MELTQAYLKSVLHYDPKTGIFTWLPRDATLFKKDSHANAWNAQYSGKIAGSMSLGYVVVGLLSKRYKVHRLAFLYMNGALPDDQVDHINGDRSDNRFCNLRCVTHKENSRNQKKHTTNNSGHTGVYRYHRNGKWGARICVNGEMISCGHFFDKESAIEARKSAEIRYGFHPNHGRKA